MEVNLRKMKSIRKQQTLKPTISLRSFFIWSLVRCLTTILKPQGTLTWNVTWRRLQTYNSHLQNQAKAINLVNRQNPGWFSLQHWGTDLWERRGGEKNSRPLLKIVQRNRFSGVNPQHQVPNSQGNSLVVTFPPQQAEKTVSVLLSCSPACEGWNILKTWSLLTKQIPSVMLAISCSWNVCLNYTQNKLKHHPCSKGCSRRHLKISVSNLQSENIQTCFKSSLPQAPALSLH